MQLHLAATCSACFCCCVWVTILDFYTICQVNNNHGKETKKHMRPKLLDASGCFRGPFTGGGLPDVIWSYTPTPWTPLKQGSAQPPIISLNKLLGSPLTQQHCGKYRFRSEKCSMSSTSQHPGWRVNGEPNLLRCEQRSFLMLFEPQVDYRKQSSEANPSRTKCNLDSAVGFFLSLRCGCLNHWRSGERYVRTCWRLTWL